MSGRDPAGQLLRALRRSSAAAGCVVALSHEATSPWASATFVGAQHRVSAIGQDLAEWLSMLPEAELALRGCFVADCAVEVTTNGAMLTALVLED